MRVILAVTMLLAFIARAALAARYASPAVIGPAPAHGVLRVYLKAMSAFGPHRLVFTNLRTGAVSTVSTPGGAYGLAGLATTLAVAAGDSVRIQMFNDNTGGTPAPGYEDPASAWKCNGGDDFGDLYGLAASAGAPIIAVQCWEDYSDNDYNDVALIVSYEPATVATSTATPTRTPTPTATHTPTPAVTDLSVSISNGASTVTAGLATSYLVVVSSAGPSPVANASVSASFGSELTGLTWTCAAAGGLCNQASGAGGLATTISLNAGGSATFTVSAMVRPDAAGIATASAIVGILSGEIDIDPANNTASDSDPILLSADLALTKSNGAAAVIPGAATTYTLTVVNHGPSAVTDALISDVFPAPFTSVTWWCAASLGSCASAAGSGDVHIPLQLDPGGTATIVATGTFWSDATGGLTNTATVSAPAGVSDPDPSNNAGTDSDIFTPMADIRVYKSASLSALAPGQWLTYTIVVDNLGPSDAPAVSVGDDLSPDLTNAAWDCSTTSGSTCSALSGAGSLTTTVSLRAGGSATFTLRARVSSTATGIVNNTARAAPDGPVADPDPTNNVSASTPVALFPQAGLAIAKTNGLEAVTPGLPVTYTILVHNGGPSAVSGVQVNDVVPAWLDNAAWVCTATAGSSCGAASGQGNIDSPVNLLDDGQATFLLSGTVSADAHLSASAITNTASFTAPAGVTVPPGFDVSTDSDPVTPLADLSVTAASDAVPGAPPGTVITSQWSVANHGPSAATNTQLTIALPSEVDVIAPPPGCSQTGPVLTCHLGALWPDERAGLTLVIRHRQEGTLTIGATVAADEPDPAPANNTATYASLAGGPPAVIPANPPTVQATTAVVPIKPVQPTPASTLTPTPSPSPTATSSPTPTPSRTVIVKTAPPLPAAGPVSDPPAPPVWLHGLLAAIMGALILATLLYLRDPRPAVIRRINRLAADQLRRTHTPGGL